jgi:hypothetical protein
MCPHACCRNKRVHPANMPVVLPSKLLRRASDDDLADHFKRTADNDRAQAQVLHEMQRRDDLEQARHDRALEAKRRIFSRRIERAEEVDRSWAAAEAATRGNMLNRKGRAADIDERSLFTGSEAVARRYASEELLNHWQSHPRPTAAYFAGKDTTLQAQDARTRRRRPTGVRSLRTGLRT